jgi:predicted Zn-dependent protease
MPSLSCEAVLPRRRVLILGGLAVAPLCGCGPQHTLPEPGSAALAEARQAIAAAPPLQQQNRSRDQQIAMLRRVAQRVADASDPLCQRYTDQGCSFRVGLATTDQVNAFATDGNVVGVTSGMLNTVRNDSELAAVLAHEYGHHLANHIQRAGTRTQIGSLAGALLGAYLGGEGLAETGAQLGGGAARLVYSQAEEREADYLAAFMVHRAGAAELPQHPSDRAGAACGLAAHGGRDPRRRARCDAAAELNDAHRIGTTATAL